MALSIEAAAAELRRAMKTAATTFYRQRQKIEENGKYPLGWKFWRGIEALALVHGAMQPDDLIYIVRKHHQCLGAPGDFGYGTPCGDALRAVYDLNNALCSARKAGAAHDPLPA